jgi:hypothetical protein
MCENKGLRGIFGPKREEDGEHYIMDSILLCTLKGKIVPVLN